MAFREAGRYSTPRALSEDIERWLADEPVTAYREPMATRLARWGRRHRTAAVGLGALLLTAIAGLSIGTVLEWTRLWDRRMGSHMRDILDGPESAEELV
jgi:hypothetical protein